MPIIFSKNKIFWLIFSLIIFSNIAKSQEKDSLHLPEPLKATANININNNGISLFPNLSFGKPATVINLSVGKKGLFFEPELRWGLNGKPWSYIFWLRVRPKRTTHFGYHFGAHPSYIIRESTITINGIDEKRYISQRYFAVEVVPVWYKSSKFAMAFHVLASKSLDPNYGIQRSKYISLQPRWPHISLSKKYYLSFFPQVFHLILDDKSGNYYSHLVSFNKNNSPIGLTSVFTYKINSTIPGDNVVWNVGLNIKF